MIQIPLTKKIVPLLRHLVKVTHQVILNQIQILKSKVATNNLIHRTVPVCLRVFLDRERMTN